MTGAGRSRGVRLPVVLIAVAVLAACGGRDDPGGEAAAEPAVRVPFAGEPPTLTPGLERPASVVIVMVDALRADRLGAYGSREGLTPNLDELAGRSVVFDEAHLVLDPVVHRLGVFRARRRTPCSTRMTSCRRAS